MGIASGEMLLLLLFASAASEASTRARWSRQPKRFQRLPLSWPNVLLQETPSFETWLQHFCCAKLCHDSSKLSLKGLSKTLRCTILRLRIKILVFRNFQFNVNEMSSVKAWNFNDGRHRLLSKIRMVFGYLQSSDKPWGPVEASHQLSTCSEDSEG